MNVLTFTSLYPNAAMPNFCVFVKYRMEAFAAVPGNALRVVAPVPYAPGFLKGTGWGKFARVPRVERQGAVEVHHPRYPLVPKVSMHIHWLLLLTGALPAVRRLRRSFPFHLIDSHFIYPDGLAAVALGRLLKVPVVLSARGSDVHEFSELPTIRPMIRRALRSCDAVISVCGALRDRMVELGAPGEKISVIPNGVDARIFPLVERSEARGALGLPRDAKIVLSVGALKELKGHHVTVEALARMLPSVPQARLHIVGEGPERPALEALIGARGLGDRVVLVGERPNRELYLWYNAADCFCLASSREGWANVLMEALACGTPVVATNVWGAPEIVSTPEVGLLCTREPGDLAAKLQAALSRTWDRAAIRAHVAGRTWETVGREVAGVFEEVLARRGASPGVELRGGSGSGRSEGRESDGRHAPCRRRTAS